MVAAQNKHFLIDFRNLAEFLSFGGSRTEFNILGDKE
jgi:hypothetical protein